MSADLILNAKSKELGDFPIHRVLPSSQRRMVGPFIFLDHMGPVELKADHPMSVRPHPHIGLSTLTYLFEGSMHHRDSLGSDQLIEPGAINWMTAGHGIVHSERSPKPLTKENSRVHGLQFWVALPADQEEGDARFQHFPASIPPERREASAHVRVIMGNYMGLNSPAQAHSDLFLVDIQFEESGFLILPSSQRELGIYVIRSSCRADGMELTEKQLGIWNFHREIPLEASKGTHLILFGGTSVGERFIWWNLVSSSRDRLEAARRDWDQGPSPDNPRFKPVPGDDLEYIPAPTF